jgi:putative peptidoglycan lipid II flippase
MSNEGKKSQAGNMASVSNAAFKVMAGSVFSMLAGFLNQVLIAALFGTGPEMDAFFTALVVPVYLQAVLLGGLSFVFIPAFVREESSGNDDDAWSLVGTFIWLIGSILLVIAGVGAFFAENIIQLSAPELPADKADLAVAMLRIMIFSVPLMGLGSLTQGVQNARNSFFWPSVATAANSLANIAVLLALYPFLEGIALAWASLGAIVVQASITITPVLRHGWKRLMPLSDTRVREMAWLITPFLLFGLLTRCVPLIERYFASGLPDGEISYLGYAFKISTILVALLGGGITTAIFPAMARAYNEGGETNLAEWTAYGMRLSIALALPALAILSAVSTPMVAVLFERNAFDRVSTINVSRILPYFILNDVVFFMLVNIVVRSLYVIKKTYTVQIINALSALLYIPFAAVLVEPYGYVGLALARPLYGTVVVVILTGLLIYRLPFVELGRLFRDIALYITVGIATFLATWIVSEAVAMLPALIHLAIAGTMGAVLYMLLLFLVDQRIAMAMLDIGGKRLGGKFLQRLPLERYLPKRGRAKKAARGSQE